MHDFSFKNFCLTVPKYFVGELASVYRKISGSEKIYASEKGEGVSRFSVEIFLSHSAEKFRRGILYYCINFGYRKILEERGVSRFYVENFLSHNTEKLRRGTLWCFRNFPVVKNFMLQRVMSRFSIFCRNFFVSQCRKYSQVNPSVLCFRKFPVAKTFMDKRGGGVSRFSVENFLSHSAEKFRRGILYCCINFGCRKILEERGVSRFYVENFLSHTAENFRRGIFCCCINFR